MALSRRNAKTVTHHTQYADIVMDETRGKTPQFQFADLTRPANAQLEEELAPYLPQILCFYSTSPILDILSAAVFQVIEFTPLDNPCQVPILMTVLHQVKINKKIDMGFAFPLFLANEILFKSEPRRNGGASKIRSLLRKMDGYKQHRTVRKTRNM